LHTKELRSQIEDQVVALTVRQRLEDADTKLGGRMSDCQLGNGTLLVGREHY